MKYFQLLCRQDWNSFETLNGMKFKFADSISVGSLDSQTIPLKAIINHPDLLKQFNLKPLLSKLNKYQYFNENLFYNTGSAMCLFCGNKKKKLQGRGQWWMGNFGLGLDLRRCYNLLLYSQNTKHWQQSSSESKPFLADKINYWGNTRTRICKITVLNSR